MVAISMIGVVLLSSVVSIVTISWGIPMMNQLVPNIVYPGASVTNNTIYIDNTTEYVTENILLQFKHYNTFAYDMLFDTNTSTYAKINDTELSITTQGNSRLYARFTGIFYLEIQDEDVEHLEFVIAVVVEGTGNQTHDVLYFEAETIGEGINRFITYSISIDYVTPQLTSGTYNIGVYWKSDYRDPSNLHTYLNTGNVEGFNAPRTLTVMEIEF